MRQAEFEVLNVIVGTRGRDEPDSPFLAEALPRASWDPDNKPALRNIARVVLVHRLREVMALVGFTQFEPAGTDEKGELDLDGIAPAALSPEPEWFPAIENRGEGIFIAVSPETIANWRDQVGVRQRGTKFLAGTNAWINEHPGSDRKFLGNPYIMLHSLAHMLLTRISLDCGYPAAALRERIYALSDVGMYGILLHTARRDPRERSVALWNLADASASIFSRPSRKPGCAQTILSAPSMMRAPSTTPCISSALPATVAC